MSNDSDQPLSYVEELARAVLEDRVHLITKNGLPVGTTFVQIVVDHNRPGVKQ